MSDLIRREDALAVLCFSQETGQMVCGDLRKLLEEIKAIPSAEPERMKGEWIDGLPYVNSHWWVCSICHVSAPENHTGYNFCPNCGADMRGE